VLLVHHWRRQEGHPAKIVHLHQNSSTLRVVKSESS